MENQNYVIRLFLGGPTHQTFKKKILNISYIGIPYLLLFTLFNIKCRSGRSIAYWCLVFDEYEINRTIKINQYHCSYLIYG